MTSSRSDGRYGVRKLEASGTRISVCRESFHPDVITRVRTGIAFACGRQTSVEGFKSDEVNAGAPKALDGR